MIGCPHGDPTCPCPDSFGKGHRDPCHYEGENAMRCPTMPDHAPGYHCHAEGCRWNQTDRDGCGLAKLGIPVPEHWPVLPSDPLHWVCGAVRLVDAMKDDFWNQVIEKGEASLVSTRSNLSNHNNQQRGNANG